MILIDIDIDLAFVILQTIQSAAYIPITLDFIPRY